MPGGIARHGASPHSTDVATRSAGPVWQPCPAAVEGEGVLHDARNLMGALGLYSDLLTMPGVLKPEHFHYAEELRLLGTRSRDMIERLMQSLHSRGKADDLCVAKSDLASPVWAPAAAPAGAGMPVSLRSIVERCSGLLSGVSGGPEIKVTYGEAAAIPVRVTEEAVERILVNLVRNAAAALHQRDSDRRALDPWTSQGAPAAAPARSVPESFEDWTEDETPGAIRIGVGLLVNRVGDPKPWPFRRVRLVVEDSGCGMSAEQLNRLLCEGRAPSRGSHGIGFRVVRELVAASNGDLRVMSTPGVGTRVQIEWPVASLSGTADESAKDPGEQLSGQPQPAAVKTSPLPSTRSLDEFVPDVRSRRFGDTRANAERRISC